MNHRQRTVMKLALLAVSAGCASLPHARPEDATRAADRWPGTSVATLETDRARYVAKCSGCHRLRLPEKYPAEKWTAYLDKMNDRAKLTPADREQILRYLVTMAGRGRT